METSPEKILKPKQWPAGKTKIGGLRVRIEWEDRSEIVFTDTGTITSTKRKTGIARSPNPFKGRNTPFVIPAKKIGKAILDSKGEFIIKGEIAKPKYWTPFDPIMTWEGQKLPSSIKKLQ